MGEMRAALVKATRALDAELALREQLVLRETFIPLRDALGEGLNMERFLDEQRAVKATLETQVTNLREMVAGAEREAKEMRANADADMVAKQAAADSWLADAKAQGESIVAAARGREAEAERIVAEAKANAARVVADAETAARMIADGKTEELIGLDSRIADKKADLAGIESQCGAARDTLNGLNRELASIKARLG